jgi:hypothetical protein
MEKLEKIVLCSLHFPFSVVRKILTIVSDFFISSQGRRKLAKETNFIILSCHKATRNLNGFESQLSSPE